MDTCYPSSHWLAEQLLQGSGIITDVLGVSLFELQGAASLASDRVKLWPCCRSYPVALSLAHMDCLDSAGLQ